ncbi:hypothetical protein AU510_15680 [Lonsdalea britannica]|uniref:hypothetical protein n=1 Tax=Lonsdalea britannica TaxID=1082704 RepID=UPI000A1FA596|nr:hypothetical protein [Lonsdalea britannica]OSN03108.1 hypothetical protein AU510_15680 [Lonsdalea britannica]
MKNIKKIATVALAVTTFCTAGAALAGPQVTVTFKNLGTQDATYKMVTANEYSTNANSTPTPKTKVFSQSTDSFIVQNKITADANAAIVRYTMGSKTCVFGTTFVNQFMSGGLFSGSIAKAPKWTKTATASNGAICTATIKYQNPIDFSWAVEFTMK